MTLRTTSRIAICLGMLSVVAVGAATLALHDIYHNEADLTLEWSALRVSFLIIIAFHAFALATAWKASKSVR